jgi:hypothetical protein
VVRWLLEDNGLSYGEGVIVRMDDNDAVEPCSYRGRTCFVETADCDPLEGEPASEEND